MQCSQDGGSCDTKETIIPEILHWYIHFFVDMCDLFGGVLVLLADS